MNFLKIAVLLLILTACAGTKTPPPPAVVSTESPARATQIAGSEVLTVGKQQYDLRCAHCHGYSGEGQLPQTIERTEALGMLTVPAHNSTGHTWRHPDQLLIRTIKEGISNPLDQFPMEPYADVMTDAQIDAVLLYIKLWWTEEQRIYQRQLSVNWAALERSLGS